LTFIVPVVHVLRENMATPGAERGHARPIHAQTKPRSPETAPLASVSDCHPLTLDFKKTMLHNAFPITTGPNGFRGQDANVLLQ
jgi:hypothetical protein